YRQGGNFERDRRVISTLLPGGTGVPSIGLESATTKSAPGSPGLTSPTLRPTADSASAASSNVMHWRIGIVTNRWSDGAGQNVMNGSQGGGRAVGHSWVGANDAP